MKVKIIQLHMKLFLLITSLLFSNSIFAVCNTDIDMGNNKITNLAAPTANADIATKKYVDDRSSFHSAGFTVSGAADYQINIGCGRTGLLMMSIDNISNGIWSSVAAIATSFNGNTVDNIEVISRYQYTGGAIQAQILSGFGENYNGHLVSGHPRPVGFDQSCGWVRLNITRLDHATTARWWFIGTGPNLNI